MFCPKCSAKYGKGIVRCSDCDVALMSEFRPGGNYVRVFVTTDPEEVNRLEELLEANGIEVIDAPAEGSWSPWGRLLEGKNPNYDGPEGLFVLDEDADLARQILEESQRG